MPPGAQDTRLCPDVPVKTKATQLVSDRFSDMPAVYGLLSGITHGMPHMLGTNAGVADRRGQWDADLIDVGASILVAVGAAHAVFDAHA